MENGTAENKYAIHAAAREGQTNLVESLLNANPRLAARRDEDDRQPLHWAASYNRLDIVELLMQQQDFDPDAKDGSGWTPLMIAASLKDGETLVDKLLGAGADVNAKNSNGQVALHFCASKNNIDVARTLISHGATSRVKDKRQQLPLHRAAAIGSAPMVQLFLDDRSPINATDMSGLTPLHHAIAEGHGDAAVLLLKAGAATDKVAADGRLAIQCAPDDKIKKFVIRSAEEEGIDLPLSMPVRQ